MQKIKVHKSIFILFILLFLKNACFADEGMWLPIFLQQLNEKEMRAAGMKLHAKDIYDINKGSLKDAVVRFGAGCTGEMVSANGLLFTNYHCGIGSIQRNSSVEKNYIKDGFWSYNQEEELPCPGMTVTFISRIEEVTAQALEGISEQLSETERQSKIDININKLLKNIQRQAYEEVSVKPFFEGNRYFAFVSIVYKDIRLVGAPPESLGKYGDVTDNWVWPRHTADFAVFRVYADANNLPNDYATSNVAFKPKHFFPISLKGIKENDFTMIMGFPGRTEEYLPAIGVQYNTEVLNPVRISLRESALAVMARYMKSDAKIKIDYTPKQYSIANYWKKWIGESQGVKQTHGVAKKLQYEADFKSKLNNDPILKSKYGTILDEFQEKYTEINPYAVAREAISEIFGRMLEITSIANQSLQLIKVYNTQSPEKYIEAAAKMKTGLASFYKSYNTQVDRDVFVALMKVYKEKVESGLQVVSINKTEVEKFSRIYETSNLCSEQKMTTILNLPSDSAVRILEEDVLLSLYSETYQFNQNTISPKANQLGDDISVLKRKYMEAQIDVFKDRKFYPDANSTLRVSYGKVKSYTPLDAVNYLSSTTIDGVMQKYIPGDYEFDLPAKYIDLYNKKDFGPYASKGVLNVNFIGSNHTTGGSSGSPAIDARGNLIGINFDRVWEGTMSDINYDPSICRNIMVDIRYVLWVIDKLGGAKNIIQELKIKQ